MLKMVIPSFRILELRERLSKLSRVAKKLGQTPPSLTVEDLRLEREFFVTIKSRAGEISSYRRSFKCSSVIVEGLSPMIQGYRVVAKIETCRDDEGKFFSSPGERELQKLKYLFSRSYYSDFGTIYFHHFTLNDALLIWKTSLSVELEENELFCAKFKVREHKVYRDKKQTYISHLKKIDHIPLKEAC